MVVQSVQHPNLNSDSDRSQAIWENVLSSFNTIPNHTKWIKANCWIKANSILFYSFCVFKINILTPRTFVSSRRCAVTIKLKNIKKMWYFIHFWIVGSTGQANIANLATRIQIRIPANNNKYKLLLKVIDWNPFLGGDFSNATIL